MGRAKQDTAMLPLDLPELPVFAPRARRRIEQYTDPAPKTREVMGLWRAGVGASLIAARVGLAHESVLAIIYEALREPD